MYATWFLLFVACDDPNCLECPGDATTCTYCADGYYIDGSEECSSMSCRCTLISYVNYQKEQKECEHF